MASFPNRTPEGNGYWKVRIDGKQVREHVAVAEEALGHKLPTGARVHHVDYDRSNNASRNLVICPSDSYHKLLHQRTDALAACGNANWLKCWICGIYSPPESVVVNGRNRYHRICDRKQQRAYRRGIKR